MSGYTVTAFYEPKMDDKRHDRIHTAFKRCGVRLAVHDLTAEHGFSVTFSDVDWTALEDGSETELIIHCEELDNATRLVSELRACGMIVTVRAEADEVTS